MRTIIILFMIFSCSASAQCIQFTYDAAGDRISRSVCPQALIADTKETLESKNAALQVKSDGAISIFPNPTTGIIQITSQDGVDYESVMVSDILGRVLINKKNFGGTLDISHLQEGRYFIKVRKGDSYKIVTVIKQ